MDINNLKKESDKINKLVKENVKDDFGKDEPIYDGIIDFDLYSKAKIKILWILKEPWEEGDYRGGWYIRDNILRLNSYQDFSGGKQTYEPMTYVAYSLLNNFPCWNDIEYIQNDPKMLTALKSIAYINIKKLPGTTKSNNSIIKDYYNKYKNILLKQIELFSPDIIIGGTTLYLFYEDLKIQESDIINSDCCKYTIKEKRLYIDAYHPSYPSFKTQDNIDDIINIAKKWYNEVLIK